jgi:protoporphyrinogen oxidase
VTNKFGARLFDIFFKTYTEKVWGMSCSDISADWAAQRIKGFSLRTAVLHAFFPPRQKASNKDSVKTLIKSFRYPRLGPGMMWDAARDQIMARGGQVLMDRKVVGLSYDAAGWTVTTLSADGQERRYTTDHVVSSAPLRDIIRALDPAAPADALAAADGLKYRDFITVALVVKDRHAFDDNWIYIHEPKVMVGRIQNFKSWSPEMVPDQDLNCLGLEYFCHEGDGLWSSTDAELVALATRELRSLGLVAIEDIISGSVVRQPKAYPVYDDGYQDRVNVIRNAVASRFPGLHLVGRNGMHRYNNQDHAMITALLTAKNILAGRQVFDPWQVNGDAEYHEDGHAGEGWNPVPEKRL